MHRHHAKRLAPGTDDADVTDLEALLRDTNPQNLDWDTQRIWRAMVLAPNLQTVVALLNQEPVPPSALDPHWARRLGMA